MTTKKTETRKVVVGGKYRHYKGNLYFVLALAKHSETQEDLVVYLCLYESDMNQVWVRPRSIFTEDVLIDGKKIPRFTQV